METGPEAVGPFTELVARYGPAVWAALADSVPRRSHTHAFARVDVWLWVFERAP